MDRTPARTARRIIAAALWLGLGGPLGAVEFADSIEAARAAGGADKPVVVTFSAPWCGWCRKMASTTFPDPQVDAVAGQFLWVKLDPDDAPELAARYGVQGLPHTVVLNSDGQLIGAQPGYMSPAAFVQFLEESLANPDPIDVPPAPLLKQLADLEHADDPATVIRTTVERLAREDRRQRDLLLKALSDAGPHAYPHLAALLADDRLAIRAAAAGVLQQLTAIEQPFDPFAAPAERAQQAAPWIKRFPPSSNPP